MTKVFVSFVFSFLLLGVAHAEEPSFEQRVQNEQRRCPRLNCPSGQVWVVHMSDHDQRAIPAANRSQIKNLIQMMVHESWTDTIQQGDLKIFDRLRMDQYEKLMVDQKHVGYRVTFSEKAWDLTTCSYQAQNLDSLSTCATGRIQQSVFISLDGRTLFSDESDWARFIPDTADLETRPSLDLQALWTR